MAEELSRAGCCARCGIQLDGESRLLCSKCGCPVQASPAEEDCACTPSSLSILFTNASPRTLGALAGEQELSAGEDASISRTVMVESSNGTHAIGAMVAAIAEAIPPKENLCTEPGSAPKTREISTAHHLPMSPWGTSTTPKDRIRALVLQSGPFSLRNTRSPFKSLPSPPRQQLSQSSSDEDEDYRHEGTCRVALRGQDRGNWFHAQVPSVANAVGKPSLPPRPRHLVLSVQQATAARGQEEVARAGRAMEPTEAEARGEIAPTQDEDNTTRGASREHEGQVLGLKWKEVDEEEAATAQPISNPRLAEALERKSEFTQEELFEMQVSNLSQDSYIMVGERYYKPVGKEQGPMTWFDFFLTGRGLVSAYAMMIALVFLSVTIAYFAL